MNTSTITLRLSTAEKKIVSLFAKSRGISVSEFARKCMLEKIEEEYDLKVIEEYEREKDAGTLSTYSFDEIMKELNL